MSGKQSEMKRTELGTGFNTLRDIGDAHGCRDAIEEWLRTYTHTFTVEQAIPYGRLMDERSAAVTEVTISAMRQMFGSMLSHAGALTFERSELRREVVGRLTGAFAFLHLDDEQAERAARRGQSTDEDKAQASKLAAATISESLKGMI